MRITALLLFLFSSTAIGSDTDWNEVEKALNDYISYPSSENALIAAKSLPQEHAPWGESSPSAPAAKFIYDGRQFSLLEHQVGAGHVESIQLAFKLFSISDGAFTEDLQIMLGKLIRPNPQLFLEELARSGLPNTYYDGLLGNNGYALVDRLDAQCLEWNYRIEALRTVASSELEKIKQSTLAKLEEIKSKYC